MYKHRCVKRNTQRSISTHLRSVYLHLMERIDCDEDVSHIRVNLIFSIAGLKLLCDRVLKKKIKATSMVHPTGIKCFLKCLDNCQDHILRDSKQYFGLCPASESRPVTPVTSMYYLHVIRWLILLSSHCQDRYINNSRGGTASLIPAELLTLRDGWKYPLATETDCIIQYINAVFRFDKLL